MEKALSTTEFILKLKDLSVDELKAMGNSLAFPNGQYDAAVAYAQLMQQPLELGMFVPCVDGKPVEEPKRDEQDMTRASFTNRQIEYQQAQERVIFEGWTGNAWGAHEKDGRHTLHFYKENEVRLITKIVVPESHITKEHSKDKWMTIDDWTIEDLARHIDLKPTKTFLDKIGI